MKLSARNILSGTVVTVVRGATTAHVTVEVAPGQIITASITNESANDLALAPGLPVKAIVKSSDVIIGVD
jgi:molybdopterin-binding protein